MTEKLCTLYLGARWS